MGRKNRKRFEWVPYLCIAAGLLCMLYPYCSEYIFQNRTASVISTYERASMALEESQHQEMLEQAQRYNEYLAGSQEKLTDPFQTKKGEANDLMYDQLLSTGGSDVMAYIEIPKINVVLPIYHGTSSQVLSNGVGHLEGTSLPVGGQDTHTVLTGHTGIDQARLLSDLNEIEEGDVFCIYVLGACLKYQVFDVETVLPDDTEGLQIIKGEDRATLVTCTPYGINTHRLLVHGRRMEEGFADVEAPGEKTEHSRDSQWQKRYQYAALIGGLLIIGIILLFSQDILKIAGICLMISGTFLFISPELMQTAQKVKMQIVIQTYEKSEETQKQHQEESALYQKMVTYNQTIYREQQKGLDNLGEDGAMENFENEMIGILEIPAMNQDFPIYAGATAEHMSEGVAVMKDTSLPVGGEDTNCVIAGHRGYNRSKTFFKDIECLSAGDRIYIKNSWEELVYEVEKIDIVTPNDVDAVKIRPGKDMVTLLTCHPYGSNGKYRYLVYCSRVKDAEKDDRKKEVSYAYKDHIVASDGQIYSLSSKDIQKEKYFRWLCAIILFLIMAAMKIKDMWRKRRQT